MGKTSIWLLLISGALGLAAVMLLLRMAAVVNKVAPPEKRVRLIEICSRMAEIRRLHEDLFPASRLSELWWVLTLAGVAACAAAIIVELVRTSR